MLCQYFSNVLGPCFVLFSRISINQSTTNNTDFFTCKERCAKLRRTVPSFTIVQRADMLNIYSQCKQSSLLADCAFPIDVNYDYENEVWLDGSTNGKVNLPWKRRISFIKSYRGSVENFPGEYPNFSL